MPRHYSNFCGKQLILAVMIFLLSALRPADAQQDEFQYLYSEFYGETVKLLHRKSGQIEKLYVSLILPEHHKFAEKDDSIIRLFTENEGLFSTFKITETFNAFELKKRLNDEILFAELILKICKSDNENVCKRQKILFEIPIDPGMNPTNIDLSYALKGVQE